MTQSQNIDITLTEFGAISLSARGPSGGGRLLSRLCGYCARHGINLFKLERFRLPTGGVWGELSKRARSLGGREAARKIF